MTEYRWTNEQRTSALRLSDSTNIAEDGNGWAKFQIYFLAGGVVDPWKTTIELLESAKAEKRQEILSIYQVEEDSLEITAGAVYPANPQFISDLYVETQLANMNGESSIIVFDTSDNPHSISIGVVEPALQSMRSLAKDLRIKGRGYLVTIAEALTIEEVESIVWE